MDDPVTFWSRILSRDAEQVRAVWDSLDENEQAAVHAHLTRMVTEDDWSDPQRISAQAALDALRNLFDPPA